MKIHIQTKLDLADENGPMLISMAASRGKLVIDVPAKHINRVLSWLSTNGQDGEMFPDSEIPRLFGYLTGLNKRVLKEHFTLHPKIQAHADTHGLDPERGRSNDPTGHVSS